MTVLEEQAAGGVATEGTEVGERPVVKGGNGFRTYLLVGLAAVVIGVGAVVGVNELGLMGTDEVSPAQIAEIRAQQLAEELESRYWAQLGKIYEQRAEEMVEFYARQHQAGIDWIGEQRAQDMVTFKRGWKGEGDS